MAEQVRYFLTGATGFLGREVLIRLLQTGQPTLVITRRRNEESHADALERINTLIAKTKSDVSTDSMTVAFADITEPDLALSDEARDWLMSSQDPVQIIHGAAEVRFDLPYKVMHLRNVLGTQHVVTLARSLAEAGRFARLDHVSTTYVAGRREGLVQETDLFEDQEPRNEYERTKYEAEVMLAEAAQDLPVAVFRPSIIVGDSRTGQTSSFKVLYWPMRVYAHGRWRTLFGRPDCTVDVVPVNFVADAIVHLGTMPETIGKTYHLAAGPDRQATIKELVAIAEEIFDQPPVRYVDPDVYMRYFRPFVLPFFKLFRPDVADRGGVFLPYLRDNPTFAVDRATEALSPAGILPEKVVDYFDTIVRYAKETDFGRGSDEHTD